MSEFWINDLGILSQDIEHFFPNNQMTENQKLNALTRYSIIIFLLFLIVESNYYWLFLPITIIIICIMFYFIKNENFEEDIPTCRNTNINNPYMNILATENKNKLEPCNNQKDKIDKNYKFNLYQNLDDLFDKKHLERQYYTMPNTIIPNNQTEFSKWLYKNEGSCKNDGVRCLEYEDERFH